MAPIIFFLTIFIQVIENAKKRHNLQENHESLVKNEQILYLIIVFYN